MAKIKTAVGKTPDSDFSRAEMFSRFLGEQLVRLGDRFIDRLPVQAEGFAVDRKLEFDKHQVFGLVIEIEEGAAGAAGGVDDAGDLIAPMISKRIAVKVPPGCCCA